MTGTGTYFFPGDPPCLLILRAVEPAVLTVEKIISIVVKRVDACIERAPELRSPLALMLQEIYADATPT
jgi:hypothetical protein